MVIIVVLVSSWWYRHLGGVHQLLVEDQGGVLEEVGVGAEGTLHCSDHIRQSWSERWRAAAQAALINPRLSGPLRGQSGGAPPGSRPFVENRHPDLPERPLAKQLATAYQCGQDSLEFILVASGLADSPAGSCSTVS